MTQRPAKCPLPLPWSMTSDLSLLWTFSPACNCFHSAPCLPVETQWVSDVEQLKARVTNGWPGSVKGGRAGYLFFFFFSLFFFQTNATSNSITASETKWFPNVLSGVKLQSEHQNTAGQFTSSLVTIGICLWQIFSYQEMSKAPPHKKLPCTDSLLDKTAITVSLWLEQEANSSAAP